MFHGDNYPFYIRFSSIHSNSIRNLNIRQSSSQKRKNKSWNEYNEFRCKIIVLDRGIIEFFIQPKSHFINAPFLRKLFYVIIDSNEFKVLNSAKITLMSGLNDGSWVSIGSSLNINIDTKEEEFINHYLDALKVLQDKHYTINEFTFLINHIIPVTYIKK